MKKLFYVLLLQVVFVTISTAQVDPHSSQYYADALSLNPALTGIMDGPARITVGYRTQWANISPFNTALVSFDAVTNKNINYGVRISNLSAGNNIYNILNISGSLSYTGLKWGSEGFNQVSFGVQFGAINRRFNQANFQYGSQYSPVDGFDPSKQGEVLTNPQTTQFDLNFGAVYFDANPNHRANLFIGGAANHLTQPKDQFMNNLSNGKLPIRYVAHGGVKIKLNDRLSFVPNLLYMYQNGAEEKMAGGYFQIKVNALTDLLLGGNARWDDAATAYAGFQMNNFILGASADFTTSTLTRGVRNSNTFEITGTYLFKKKTTTPSVNFICPRL